MTKKQEFINFIETILKDANIGPDSMPENVQLYWNAFRGADETGERPMFTDNGKLILQFMKDKQTTPMWKAKDIAEELFISSRTVSGAMRKLVTDGFVEKVGQDPVVYSLNDFGKNIEIN